MAEEVKGNPSELIMSHLDSPSTARESEHLEGGQGIKERAITPPKLVRCGKMRFYEVCQNVKFIQNVYANVDIEMDTFQQNFIVEKDKDLSQRNVETVKLTIGIEGKIDSDRYPGFEDSNFIIFGFLENHKKPHLCQCIISESYAPSFSLIPIMDFYIDWEPKHNPHAVQQFFPEFVAWALDVAEKGRSLSDLILKPQKKRTYKNPQVLPAREPLSRSSKTNARGRILDMSPSKRTKVESYESHSHSPLAEPPNPCSCSKELLALKNQQTASKAATTKLKGLVELQAKEIMALKERVGVLERGHNAIGKVKTEKKRTKSQKPRMSAPQPDTATILSVGDAHNCNVDDSEKLTNILARAVSKIIKAEPELPQLPQTPLPMQPAANMSNMQYGYPPVPYRQQPYGPQPYGQFFTAW